MLSHLTALIAPLFSTIDKVVTNKAEAEKIKLALQQDMLTNKASEFKAAADIIISEAKGESWLQRNWRPLLMLWFAGLIGAHWMGFTAPNISEEILNGLLDIVKIGIGGYVIGRSTEKIVKEASHAITTLKPAQKPDAPAYHFNN
jgi:hypothetical protein